MVELVKLAVAALVDMTEFVLVATSLGICTGMSRGFPIYCSVHTTRLVALLLTLDTRSRDDSLSIYCTIPCLFLGTSAHSLGDLDKLRSLFEDSILQLLSLQAHPCSNPWLPWIAP